MIMAALLHLEEATLIEKRSEVKYMSVKSLSDGQPLELLRQLFNKKSFRGGGQWYRLKGGWPGHLHPSCFKLDHTKHFSFHLCSHRPPETWFLLYSQAAWWSVWKMNSWVDAAAEPSWEKGAEIRLRKFDHCYCQQWINTLTISH